MPYCRTFDPRSLTTSGFERSDDSGGEIRRPSSPVVVVDAGTNKTVSHQVTATTTTTTTTTTNESSQGNELAAPTTMVTASFQSDESSDGFSLVDDGGDSLMGSENYVASEPGGSESASTPQSNGETATEGGTHDDVENLTPLGNKQVCCGKMVLLTVLILATTAVSVPVYFSAHQAEVEAFENAFFEQATALATSWGDQMSQHLGMVDALGAAVTSYSSILGGAPWPLVTVPAFAELSADIGESVLLVPIVKDREEWEAYAMENLDWVDEQASRRLDQDDVHPQIFRVDEQNDIVADEGNPAFSPVWQTSPVEAQLVNYNLASHPQLHSAVDKTWELEDTVLSETLVEDLPIWNLSTPTVFTMHPFFNDFGSGQEMVGMITSIAPWANFLARTQFPTTAVIENSCDQSFSFAIDDNDDVVYLGTGNKRDPEYDSMEESFDLNHGSAEDVALCMYTLRIYPTSEMEDAFISKQPRLYVFAVVMMATAILLAFCLYDCCVQNRHEIILAEAIRSRKIVSSLFPSTVHDRLFKSNATPTPEDYAEEYKNVITNMATIEERKRLPTENGGTNLDAHSLGASSRSLGYLEPPMQRLRSFLSDLPGQSEHTSRQSVDLKDEPIADLFPDATVMFADISGFTAWSSVREPAQVFQLLETIYRAFDKLARKKKVFKVETIGDCYVAVTGLPDPQPDHALIMTRYAKECMLQMNELTKELEVALGPDTSELCMRFGLHSGPVTAGVLRGEKSRFQLFGDTVNFASRMESTGTRNRIQVSQATADLLIDAGKQDWVQPREDLVNAKGLGQVQTFWVVPRRSNNGSSKSLRGSMDSRTGSCIKLKRKGRGVTLNRESSSRKGMLEQASSRRSLLSAPQLPSDIWRNDNEIDMERSDSFDVNRQERLIDWNVEILLGMLKRIASHREAEGKQESEERVDTNLYQPQQALEEITEIIPLSNGGKNCTGQAEVDLDNVFLHRKVEDQLREYVTMIACMYRDNPFHSWEHATHVTMSAQKLLKQVIKADQERGSAKTVSLNNYTCGITSDPLTQFAIVFTALIHDVDHTGVPNSQLVKEDAHIASLYKNKSIAEQNSLDLAWVSRRRRQSRLSLASSPDSNHCVFRTC
jgi:class 3 adenylate cyclase